jgi:hypothetical protein
MALIPPINSSGRHHLKARWIIAIAASALLLLIVIAFALHLPANNLGKHAENELVTDLHTTNWTLTDSIDRLGVRRLLEWNGRFIVQADEFYTLDASQITASPLRLPGAREILDLASLGPGRPVALCRDESKFFLLRGQAGDWSRHDLPRAMQRPAEHLRLAADSRAVVVFDEDMITRFEADFNEPVRLQRFSKPRLFSGNSMHRVLNGRDLYLGSDMGEFGGNLWRANTQTGECESIPVPGNNGLPIKYLGIGPDARIWELEGLAHLSLRSGFICVLSGRAWTRFCCGNSTISTNTNWNLPAASFAALAFNSADRPVVLSENLGLVRYENGMWSRLTPDWPEYLPVGSLLMSGEDQAIIGSPRAGVVILNLKTGILRRFTVASGAE